VDLAQLAGWDVCVIATPDGLRWIDAPALVEQTGHPVRHRFKNPGDPDVLPPADAMAVAPATVNTVNKWSAGIADTLALGLVVEAVGRGLPVVVLPFTNDAMAAHPAFGHSVARLREWGVTVLWGDGTLPAFGPGSGDAYTEQVPWDRVVAALPDPRKRDGGVG
jgi:phosphopantothenoylcysteine synthetase/decarboxylase